MWRKSLRAKHIFSSLIFTPLVHSLDSEWCKISTSFLMMIMIMKIMTTITTNTIIMKMTKKTTITMLLITMTQWWPRPFFYLFFIFFIEIEIKTFAKLSWYPEWYRDFQVCSPWYPDWYQDFKVCSLDIETGIKTFRNAVLITRLSGIQYQGGQGGLTNERSWTGHVISGPMRGLRKNRMGRRQNTYIDRYGRKSQLLDQLSPEGPSWWKVVSMKPWASQTDVEQGYI